MHTHVYTHQHLGTNNITLIASSMEKDWGRCNDRTKKIISTIIRQQFHSEFIDLKLFAFEVVDGFKDKNIALKMLYFIKNIRAKLPLFNPF